MCNFEFLSKFCGNGFSLVQRGSWGSGQPEMVRGLDSGVLRILGGQAGQCMGSDWTLSGCKHCLALKFPGILKISNQLYRFVLTSRNLAAPMKVHDYNFFDKILKLHMVSTGRGHKNG